MTGNRNYINLLKNFMKNSWNWLVILYISNSLTNSEYSACNDRKRKSRGNLSWNKNREITTRELIFWRVFAIWSHCEPPPAALWSGGSMAFNASRIREETRPWPKYESQGAVESEDQLLFFAGGNKKAASKAATTKGQKLRSLLGHRRIALWSSTSLA